MVVSLVTSYLRWLQKGNPTGDVEAYPGMDADGQTSLKGVYVAGDLTGVPLLKPAVESGARLVATFLADADFKARRARPGEAKDNDDIKDVVIVGGGPAGIACALECAQHGLDYLVLESAQLFETLENFPKAKPILAMPDGRPTLGPLRIENGTKESLLADLKSQVAGKGLALRLGTRVERIRRASRGPAGEVLLLETTAGEMAAMRVVLAIGKTGDARRLGVPGEDGSHVYNRLIDASEFTGLDILVVGGGDTAVEAAVALAESGNRVILSYRKEFLDRPKEENLDRFRSWMERGRITPRFRTEVKEIRPGEVVLGVREGPERVAPVKADLVFVLIGREVPKAFFKRSGIRMAGERDLAWRVFLVALISFFCMLYFGKAGVARDVFRGVDGPLSALLAYLAGPFQGDIRPTLEWSAKGHAWYSSLSFVLGWAGSLVFLASGAWSLGLLFKRRDRMLATAWGKIKYGYLAAVAAGFTGVYAYYLLGRDAGWVEGPTYWYSLLYCATMGLFGLRRVMVRKTRYIRRQVATLFFIQVVFLFLLPFHLFDPLIKANFAADSYVMKEMFPAGKWSSFGFVLFWPLNMNDFGRSGFWTWFPLVQTFGILFVIVRLWGKGAYCGWICSCGGMAETLGDEYRAAAPHGPGPKRLEHIGQAVLAWALVVTAVGFASRAGWLGGPSIWVDTVTGAYKLAIDVFFAGVLGLGVYFFLSGRVWCRFGCPLAALMHIYARFSVYRIVAEKKKCISCNLCTQACHMGIDVMNYANKGVPMDDIQCVSCSACVVACPTEVLSFARLAKTDVDNRTRKDTPDFPRGKDDWRAGLR